MTRLMLPVALLAAFLGGPCFGQVETARQPPATIVGDSVTYSIFTNHDNSVGYDVFIGSRKIIHQPSVPSLPGNGGFASREDAEKVARMVSEKVSRGVMPPTVTRKELEQLGIQLPPGRERNGL